MYSLQYGQTFVLPLLLFNSSELSEEKKTNNKPIGPRINPKQPPPSSLFPFLLAIITPAIPQQIQSITNPISNYSSSLPTAQISAATHPMKVQPKNKFKIRIRK
jgi:hypothetical protein